MGPDQYEKVRQLFLTAADLSLEERDAFLHTVGQEHPPTVISELISLLKEHDSERALREGANPETFRYLTPNHDVSHSVEPLQNKHQQSHSELERHSDSRGNTESEVKNPLQQIASSYLLATQTRKSRRRNNAWLWITALVPTMLIGSMTYYQVNKTMRQAVRDEMRGVSDSVSHAARRFLADKSHLVESWAREPAIQTAIKEWIQAANVSGSDPLTRKKLNPVINGQLKRLSGIDEIQFAIWDSENQFLTTNFSEDSVGLIREQRDIQSLIDRAKKGEMVIYGPIKVRPSQTTKDPNPEMGVLSAVRDESNSVIATILVTGIGMHTEFSRMFFDISNAGNLDAYAVDETGTMLTESPRAATLASTKRLEVTVENIAASLRVADPGNLIHESNHKTIFRHRSPLTRSAKSVTSGRSEGEIDPYRNYAGIEVVGSWRWNGDSKIGVIVERQASEAFATVRIVQGGFLLLGSLLFFSVTIAAAFLARATTAERAAVHPLSRYEVVEEVGAGGMGLVFRAKHRQLGRETALKVMIGGTQRKEDQLRFDREARLAASLSNPHSVTIYDYGRSEDGESYCVMEFLRGLTLQEVVEKNGHQPLGRVLFILRQVCEAVAEAHQKRLLHLDIKPQNIMLSLDQAVGDWAVLFDYGLSKPIAPSIDYYSSPTTKWSGTPMYMAPERFHHLDQVDQRSDIYSLGCVAYFLVTGASPFFESDPESLFTLILNQNPIDVSTRRGELVPQEFTDLINKSMCKTPEERFQTIDEFVTHIETIQSLFPWTTDDSRFWWAKHGPDAKS